MVGSISSYTTAQKTPSQIISQNNNVIGATATWTIYTVPTGKKTIITSLADRCISIGNGSKITVVVAGRQVRQPTAGNENVLTPETAAQNQVLQAGQTVQVTSDAAGNNASVDVLFSYSELPA